MTDVDIFVSGGGVAGLVAAISFASDGHRVLCVDPVPPVTDAGAEGADLRTILPRANLELANLTKAKLCGAYVQRANLAKA